MNSAKLFLLPRLCFIFLFSAVLLSFCPATADSPTDSLEQQLAMATDAQRVSIFNQLATLYRTSQADTALAYAHKALRLAERIRDLQGKALAYQNFGLIYYYGKTDFANAQRYHKQAIPLFHALGDRHNLAAQLRYLGLVEINFSRYEKALEHYNEALSIFQELKDRAGIADCYGNIATVYNFQGDYSQAINYSFKSLKYREETGNQEFIGYSYNSIGFLYTKLHKYVYALKYLEKSLQIAEKSKDQVREVFPLINIGEVYRAWGDDKKAVEYLNRALFLAKKLNRHNGLYQAYDKLGLVARKRRKYQQALDYQLKALEVCEQLANKEGLAMVLNHIGQVYFDMKNYQAALTYHHRSLSMALAIHSNPMVKDGYHHLAQTFYRLNNFKESSRYYELFLNSQDVLFNDLTERVVSERQQMYEAEKNQKEMTILRQQKELREMALAQEFSLRKWLVFIMALGIIIVALAVYLYFIKTRSNRALMQMNRQLSVSEANLQQLNATKDKLFSIISHDLRGPIQSFSGFLQLLVNHPGSFSEEEIKQVIGKVNDSVKNLSRMLANLLNWSQSQMNSIGFSPERIDLDEIVDRNIDLLNENAQAKGIHLSRQLQEGSSVLADENMLDIVLRNLIHNAIKFSREGGQVMIEARQHTDYTEISVADTGVGISTDKIATIFQTEHTFSTRGTANEQGTGLGLLLCREFIEKLGGHIRVVSESDRGTTFIFTLPS